MSSTLLRIDTVLARTGIRSRFTLYKRIRDKDFPQPVKIGERASAWIESEVDAWIKGKIDVRDAVAMKKAA